MRILVLAAVALTMLAPAGPAGAKLPRELKEVKAATAKYHSVEQALAAGYVAPPPDACAASPAGGMGYHFENPALMTDSVLDPLRPEILMYERKGKKGKLKLVGVEYYMEADRTAAAPSLFGQTFEGPMPPHHPFMEEHYDLHVWLFKKNPSGFFAMWNPDVTCP
jgi:hypothetical protein